MGLIASNPVRSLEKPRAGRRDHVISADQFRTILAMVKDVEFRDLLTVCWETGCRPQEALSVEAAHVDVEGGCWVFPVDESKGKEHQRIVYLTDAALEITRRRIAARPCGPLFVNTDGRPWTSSALNCRFARLRLALDRKRLGELGLMPPKRGFFEPTGPFSGAELLAFAILGLGEDGYDDDTAKRFWRSAIGADGSGMTGEFAEGFVEGALEIWHAVEDKL